MSSAVLPVEQHNTEIQKNRLVWQRKPMLRSIYHEFYRLISSRLTSNPAGKIVELGSGMGAIKEVIPACITTDLFPNPWLDRQENAYQLSFADGTVSNLILFDVWHHLRYPGAALREFHRVLAPGGRLVLYEPAASWLGRFVYHCFHHEPVAVTDAITWDAPPGFRPADADYFAAQGSATRLFWWGEAAPRLAGWRMREVTPVISFAYFATGGFSGPQFGGRFLHQLARGVDWLARPLPRLFAARLLVVLEKT
jgi:SAM-dependent methyltransferase